VLLPALPPYTWRVMANTSQPRDNLGMRKVCTLTLLGMITLFVRGDCWHYGPVLAYQLHASHDSHGKCWRGWCVREEAFWVGPKAERPATDETPTRACLLF
jgi:hypothetical protein